MSGRLKRWTQRALILIIAVALVVIVIFATGLADRWIRSALIEQIEQGTGARVEIGAFHFRLWGLRAEIDNLTLHGLEAADQPPLFHADRIDASIRIISFFGRQIALGPHLQSEHAERLRRLGLANDAELADAIRAGALEARREEVFSVVTAAVAAKLAVAHPGYRLPLSPT